MRYLILYAMPTNVQIFMSRRARVLAQTAAVVGVFASRCNTAGRQMNKISVQRSQSYSSYCRTTGLLLD